MKRPEFVSNEDVARWSEAINSDPNTPTLYAEQPLMRELMYAGCWLGEQLKQEGCNDVLIVRIQYTVGQLFFGHDPWEVAQEMFMAYKNNQLEFEFDYNEDA
jgi:hypothetical protein